MLQLKNVNKKIQGQLIVKDLNFSVKKGEIFGFLGPNGAGKTTTIRMIVGLSKLSSGDILIDGHSIQTSYKEAISKVGAIIEQPEMYNHLTAEMNLAHFARMNGKVDYEKINNLLTLVGLESVKKKRVKTFSLGMKQRLGIAQSLIHDPKVLILDEPTNGLDPEGIRTIRDYLKLLAKEQDLAILISSHLMSEVELLCDNYAIIQKGQLIKHQLLSSINESVKINYRLNVHQDHIYKTLEILRKYDETSYESGGFVMVHLLEEDVPNVINTLSKEYIYVYEFRQEKESLEDKFLSLTKDRGMSQ